MAQPETAPLADPHTLGPYFVEQVLRGDRARGCGAGRDPAGARVFLRWAQAKSPEALGPVAEYSCLASICDVSAPRALDLVYVGEFVVCVTEWRDGTPLSSSVDVDATAVLATLEHVLRRVHSAGWVHGDIKPSNLLLGADGAMTVIDWEFARRLGEVAPSGTAGYAMPAVLAGGQTATPGIDLYAVNVLAVELARREGVSAGQGLRADVSAARETMERGAPCLSSAGDGAASRLRLAAASSDLPHAEVIAIGQLIAEHATGTTLTDTLRAAERVAELGVPSQALAAAACSAIRMRGVGNVLPLETLLGWCRESQGTAAQDHSSVDAWCLRVTAVLKSYAPAAIPTTIVATAANCTANLRARLQTLATGEVTCLVLPSPHAAEPTIATRRAFAQSVLRAVLGASEPPTALLEAAPSAGTLSAERILSSCCGDPRASALRPRTPGCDAATELCAREAMTSNRAEFSAEYMGAVLSMAREMLLRGESGAAYSLAVRATTVAEAASGVEVREWLALGSLWCDVGAPGACVELLSRHCSLASRDVARLWGAALLAGGKSADGTLVCAALRSQTQTAADQLMCARLEAAAALERCDVGLARRAIAGAARQARRASSVEQVEWAVTRANVHRASRRWRRSAAILRRAMTRCDQIGAPRVAMRCRASLLLAEVDRPHAVRAEGWALVYADAKQWGDANLAELAAAMAARLWCASGQFERAQQVCAARASEPVRAVHRGGFHQRVLLAAEASILDRAEHFDEVLRFAVASERHEELEVRGRLLGRELGRLPSAYDPRPNGRRGRLDRLERVAATVASRARSLTLRRATGWLDAAIDCAFAGTGLEVHAVRLAGPALRHVWESLLRDWRERATGASTKRQTALALHALCLSHSWWTDSTAVGWFLEEAPADPESRPVGVRRWEWAVAHIRSGAAHHDRAESQRRRQQAAREVARFAAQMHSESRLEFAAQRFGPLRLGSSQSGPTPPATGLEGVIAAMLQSEYCLETHQGAQFGGLGSQTSGALWLRAGMQVDEVLETTVRQVLAVCPAERAVILFELNGGGARAKVGTRSGVADLPSNEAEISLTVLARVRSATSVVAIDDASADEELTDRPSVLKYRPRSLLACPLRTHSRYLGYLYVENRSRAASFRESDPAVLEGLAAQASIALENAALMDDLRSSYRELSHARSEAVRSESLRLLGRMATEVAHDLNNLLTSVLGEAQLLLMDGRFRDAYGSLRVIERAVQDGAECIRRIQDSTRVRTSAAFCEVDVGALVSDVLDFCRMRCEPDASSGRGSVRVVRQIGPRLKVMGSATELREVVTNLVVNAVDAMQQGGTLDVAVVAEAEAVHVRVRDSGVGIPPDVLPRLFEPFFTTKGSKGNGLGLSITSDIVRRHGGSISVESAVGVGSCFDVSLPRVGRELCLESAQSPSRFGATSGASEALRYLIVDDDASVLRVLRQMLEQNGVVVDEAIGGDAAVAKLDTVRRPYDCVITDMFMPAIGGLDVVDRVRQRFPAARVIVMSGCITTLEGELTRVRQVSGLLRKPFSFQAIRGLVAAS